ncbi:MAG: GTPase domain-containing protein [Phycisphaerales bacterium]|nr:GTPase domain-containing protein [Phycisphaerales bacterium]
MAEPATTAEQLASQLQSLLMELGVADDAMTRAIAHARRDLSAFQFHLTYSGPPLVALLGGTGTGKSTLLNRLLGKTISAASTLRTYTAGPIAVAPEGLTILPRWLDLPHVQARELPVRGNTQQLMVVTAPPEAQMTSVILIDTPDLDGDQPAHHDVAERIFRWATGVIFVTSPEKYQKRELLPYYRLASRYGLDVLFVMNKAENQGVIDDYKNQLALNSWPGARLFAVPRDDSPLTIAPQATLEKLKEMLQRSGALVSEATGRAGYLSVRRDDLVSRLLDQIVEPLQQLQKIIDGARAGLKAQMRPTADGDLPNMPPLAEALRRRMRGQSILYLLGPQRMWDRTRQIGRLVRGGVASINPFSKQTQEPEIEGAGDNEQDARLREKYKNNPAAYFADILEDVFRARQTEIEDNLRSQPAVADWMKQYEGAELAIATSRSDPALAGEIARQEVAALQEWIEKQRHEKPRDTLILLKILRLLPGTGYLVKLFEATPWALLLLLGFVTHYGAWELVISGGYAAVAYLMEKLSDEVRSRVNQTQQRISQRYDELVRQQIRKYESWLNSKAPTTAQIETLRQLVEQFALAKI